MALEEASTNFDAADLPEFLRRVAGMLQGGFGEAQVRQVLAAVEAMELDAQVGFDYEVVFRGRRMPLRVEVFLDDVDATDAYFFSERELARRIQEDMKRFHAGEPPARD